MSTFRIRRIRGFGEILNASFELLRLHWRTVGMALLQMVMPIVAFIVSLVVSIVLFVPDLNFEDTDSAGVIIFTILAVLASIVLMLIASALTASIYYALIRCVALGQDFGPADLRREARGLFWKVTGLYILQLAVMMGVSMIMLPFNFLMIGGGSSQFVVLAFVTIARIVLQLAATFLLSLSYPVLIMEQRSVYNCVTRSISLVRRSIGLTFGLNIMAILILYCMMTAPLVHPVLLYMLIMKLVDPTHMLSFITDSKVFVTLSVAVYSLFLVFALLFIWSVPTIVNCLLYASIVERTEGSGLMMRMMRLIPPAPETPVSDPRADASTLDSAVGGKPDAQASDAGDVDAAAATDSHPGLDEPKAADGAADVQDNSDATTGEQAG